MNPISIQFSFTPQPWPRAQVRATKRGLRFFKPGRYQKYVDDIGILMKQIHRPCVAEVEFALEFQFYLPKAIYGRTDVDNLVKAFMDAGQLILWENDKQIKKIIAEKFKSSSAQGSTILFITLLR